LYLTLMTEVFDRFRLAFGYRQQILSLQRLTS
jgi:hypothetical protein